MNEEPAPAPPRPLIGRTGTVGVPNRTSSAWIVLFGLFFFAMGGAVLGASSGWIPMDEASFHTDRWIVGCIGAVFAAVGLWIIGAGLRGPWRRYRIACNRRQYPNEPAYGDYLWDPRGAVQGRVGRVVQSLAAATVMTAFLVPFNAWVFFSPHEPFMVKLIVGFFDVIAVCTWGAFFYTLVWAIKYGPARLTWGSFPVRFGAVYLEWQPGRGLREWTQGTFTLRCVRERMERTTRPRGTEFRQCYDCLWEEARVLQGSHAIQGSGGVSLEFTLPGSAPSTAISSEEPTYWELEVRIQQPGVDFMHRYLVPVYR